MTHCQAECPYRLTDSVRGLNVSGVVVVSGSGPGGGQLYGGRSWSDNSRDTQKGFGYYVNRDRCVLKDGVYWGEAGAYTFQLDLSRVWHTRNTLHTPKHPLTPP